MKVITGTVVNGKIDLPENALRDGSQVAVLAADPDEPIRLSTDEARELQAAVDALRRGEFVSGSDLLAELRSRAAR
jgi:hypothetical protein